MLKTALTISLPAPALPYAIVTEFKKIVKKLANSEISSYISDILTILLLVVPADIPYTDNLFNKFDKNFMLDCFENEIPHFLDIKVLHLGPKEHPHWLIG